jgi:hypothetical protein
MISLTNPKFQLKSTLDRIKSGLITNRLLLIGFGLFLFLFLRFPSLFESVWYGDEAYYLTIGQALKNGQLLYVDIWDNKPPLLYIFYWIFNIIFGNVVWPGKLFNIVLGLLSIYFLDKVAYHLGGFRGRARRASFILACLFFGGMFEATIFNAENLFVPLILAGTFFTYQHLHYPEKAGDFPSLLINCLRLALTFGLAILTKISAAPEIILILIALHLPFLNFQHNPSNNIKLVHEAVLKFVAIWIPLGLTALFYLGIGHLSDFIYAVFQYNSGYVSSPLTPSIFGLNLPVSGLIYRSVLVIGVLATTFYGHFKQSLNAFHIFFILLLTGQIYSVFLSERPYPHYLFQLIPGLILGFGWIARWTKYLFQFKRKYVTTTTLFILLINQTLNQFTQGSGQLSYVNLPHLYKFYSLKWSTEALQTWQAGFDPKISQRQKILTQGILELTQPQDKIFLASNTPDVYFTSKRLNALKLVVDYHQLKDTGPDQIAQKLIQTKPKLVVLDRNSLIAGPIENGIRNHYTLKKVQKWNGEEFRFYVSNG